ncbi:MAG TPA: hypothetical protein VFV87_13070 [Pirellulaceae bacterium]|nr:hypothetical protein [Pirellulaceae bacterium]
MAHVLARLDQTGDDMTSGPTITIVRLRREIERKDQTPVDPEQEVKKSTAIRNLRYMIELLADPAFMSKAVGP